MHPEIDSESEGITDEQRVMLRRVIAWIEGNPMRGLDINDVSYAIHVLELVARENEGCTHWGYGSEMDGHSITVNNDGTIEHLGGGDGAFGPISWKAALEISEAFRRAAEVGRRRAKE